MPYDLETVIKLQTTLDELQALQEMLAGVPDWMKELHQEYSARQGEIDELKSVLEEAASDRRAAEAVVEDAQQKLQHFQEQIGQVRNQREYAAILQEVDLVKEVIREAEEEALGALERQDQAREPLDAMTEEFRELDDRYTAELKKWEIEKPEVARKAEALQTQVDELREALPRGVLAQFDRIAEHHPDGALAAVMPVARTGKGQQMWHCGGCHYRVRPQAVVQIKNLGAVIFCDSCKRILYFDETAD